MESERDRERKRDRERVICNFCMSAYRWIQSRPKINKLASVQKSVKRI
jgi:hypothetical protein